jgi:hypothetical protein
MKKPTIDQVCKVLNHKRAETGWVVRPSLDAEGKPCIVRMTRVTCVYPVDGAGRLTVLVSDWGLSGDEEPRHYINYAGGWGYDNFTAATNGATIGGIEIGNYCDHAGRATFRDLLYSQKWLAFNVPGGY